MPHFINDQTKHLHDVKLCLDPNDWLLKKHLALRVYIVDCPRLTLNKHMINKHKMHPPSRDIRLGDVQMMITAQGEKFNPHVPQSTIL